jgi:hypothetical protein
MERSRFIGLNIVEMETDNRFPTVKTAATSGVVT